MDEYVVAFGQMHIILRNGHRRHSSFASIDLSTRQLPCNNISHKLSRMPIKPMSPLPLFGAITIVCQPANTCNATLQPQPGESSTAQGATAVCQRWRQPLASGIYPSVRSIMAGRLAWSPPQDHSINRCIEYMPT
jgi:hypothetical protein